MKKFLAWLTKGSKIVKILKYIYAALVAANSAISGVEHGLDIAEKNSPKELQKANKYLTTSIYALQKILEWFGFDVYDYRDTVQQNLSTEEINSRILEVILEVEDEKNNITSLTLQ